MLRLATAAGGAIAFWPTGLLSTCPAATVAQFGLGTGDPTWNDGEAVPLPIAAAAVGASLVLVVPLLRWSLHHWRLLFHPTRVAWTRTGALVVLNVTVSFAIHFAG